MNVRSKSTSSYKFRSKFEKSVAEYLTKKGYKFEYESRNSRFLNRIRGGHCNDCGSDVVYQRRRYTPDFILDRVYLETKGRFTSPDRTKILAVLDTSAEINRSNFRLLFMRDNWTTKAGKERYTDWCKRNGIQCAVWPKIPRGFLK